jgi:hypothetical protein
MADVPDRRLGRADLRLDETKVVDGDADLVDGKRPGRKHPSVDDARHDSNVASHDHLVEHT